MDTETFIPGMSGTTPDSNSSDFNAYRSDSTMIEGIPYAASESSAGHFRPNGNHNSAPVVGFLYSVSRNGMPEYWPLYVGQNSIGTSTDMDIKLLEASVSKHHADVQIKKMRKQAGKLIATIVDAGSKNGIVVNDEELDYDRHPLQNGDILTIGLKYKLVFILIDPVLLGIGPEEDFVAIASAQGYSDRPNVPGTGMVDANITLHPDQGSPYSNPYDGYRNQDETINISDPNYDGLNAGGTRIL